MRRRREDRGEATPRGVDAEEGGGESTGSAGARPVSAVALDRFGLLCAVLAAVGFSGKAILVKRAYRYGVDAETLLALRMAFSLPFFLGMAWIGVGRAASPLTRRDWACATSLKAHTWAARSCAAAGASGWRRTRWAIWAVGRRIDGRPS